MDQPLPSLVPASVQRVRCFLQSTGKMKVRPWEPPEEVVDILYETLASRRHDDAFWSELQGLLDTLCHDASRRIEADDRRIIDNEVLGLEGRDELITEIRRHLEAPRPRRGALRDLARSLSGPSAALMLLLAGATTVGCNNRHGRDDDAAVSSDAATADAALPDASLPDAARLDAGHDAGFDAGDFDAGPLCGAVQEVAECVPDRLRAPACACLDALNESWDHALRDLMDRTGCGALSIYVECMLASCADPSTVGDFDMDMFLDNCSVPIYLGVRFT